MDCEQLKFDLAAETLAGRDEPEDPTLASHLRGCPTCREEHTEVREVVHLLSGVEPHEWDGVPVPDPGPAIVRARGASPPDVAAAPKTGQPLPAQPVGSARKGRRMAFALAAAFAAGLLAGGGALVGLSADQDPSARTEAAGETLRAADPKTGVRADVGLRDKGWGTEVSLSLGGVTGPRTCSLVAVSTSGRQEVLAHWTVPKKGYGVPGSPDRLNLTGSSSLDSGDIAAFEVLTPDGDRLVRIPRRA
ncbi:hypothetical protein ACFYWY_34425 [Streptomyces sp. NPDC002870]|uniref:hypothetical protein n=1 Tax=Streptomyces sp. NPDC002870 TaxID=3364666 RepID=UPI0036ADA089